MKWDVKHDRAKKVIDRFLDNAGYWQELDAEDMKDLAKLWSSLCPEFNCKANSVIYVEAV